MRSNIGSEGQCEAPSAPVSKALAVQTPPSWEMGAIPVCPVLPSLLLLCSRELHRAGMEAELQVLQRELPGRDCCETHLRRDLLSKHDLTLCPSGRLEPQDALGWRGI